MVTSATGTYLGPITIPANNGKTVQLIKNTSPTYSSGINKMEVTYQLLRLLFSTGRTVYRYFTVA